MNGKFVMYGSSASNVAHRDRNGVSDVFVRNMMRPLGRCVSVDSLGHEGYADSLFGGMSADGSVVVFLSYSLNLAPDALVPSVYVHNMVSGETKVVSVNSDGTPTAGYVADGACVSSDGRFSVFYSAAVDLPLGDPAGPVQVYLADLTAGTAMLVSAEENGTPGNESSGGARISGNGRYVVYGSSATNLVPGGTNGVVGVFVYDREFGITRRADIASNGTEANGSPSTSVVSDDGAVAFGSEASNLVPGDTNGLVDVFLHDFGTGETRRISVAPNGTEAVEGSNNPSISRDGNTVVFTSWADGLVPEDRNGKSDVFSYDVRTGTLRLLSVDVLGNPGDGDSSSGAGAVSMDGTWCVFASEAMNFVPRDRNGAMRDVFLVQVK